MKLLSHVQLLATLWTAAYQAPPSVGFSRQRVSPILQMGKLRFREINWHITQQIINAATTAGLVGGDL